MRCDIREALGALLDRVDRRAVRGQARHAILETQRRRRGENRAGRAAEQKKPARGERVGDAPNRLGVVRDFRSTRRRIGWSAVIGVSMASGYTQFARMPYGRTDRGHATTRCALTNPATRRATR
jgi:hypothetical protein